MEEFDYTLHIKTGEEILILQMVGTFDDAYEVARNYHHYVNRVTFFNREGDEIISLNDRQLMDFNLKIKYKD